MTLRVFLVEDMQPIQAALVELLEGSGGLKIVAMASTEAEANLWLKENPNKWDLAIIDLILKEGTGMGVVKEARKRSSTAEVVVFSDFATSGIQAHCLKLGANAVYDKSSGPQELIAHCRALDASRGT